MSRLKSFFLFFIILLGYGAGHSSDALAITPVHEIQGNSAESHIVGNICTVQGIVFGDFQEDKQLGGFFLQEQTPDADETTSEGIFVFYNRSEVKQGDILRVTGEVTEYYGLTELINISAIEVISGGNKLPDPAVIELPIKDSTFYERFEGMRVILTQKLTVSDNYDLTYYGSFIISNGRLMTPTQTAEPGADAAVVKAANLLNQIIIDDGSHAVRPDPIPYPYPTGLSAENTLRSGYTVTGLIGVMTYSFGAYRIHPTEQPKFDETSNPRSDKPDIVGRLKIAGFNVLNYFNGPAFPTSRGANTSTEFARQRAKIINAIAAMDADIIGLTEIENDGYGSESAIQDMVKGLNTASSASGVSYGFINPGTERLGSDEIAVGIIYKKEKVQPVGTPATKSDGAFAGNNRQPLAQTFREKIGAGEQFTVAVNHFKSKSSPCPDDPDMNDGQGNCNKTRTAAAQELTAWLATYPTGISDPDILIIGDLNAYPMEDPVAAIEAAAYTNLIKSRIGNSAYSYSYDGKAGYLDHALASASLVFQVKAVAEWHINADEAAILDYNEEDKTETQKISLYSDKPFRSSDHDPILIGVDLYSRKNNAALDHAIAILKILTGIKDVTYSGTDLYDDGIIGFEELIYILQALAGMRP
ncbi:MAG: hypothetical protein BWK80_19070 [Desulfobacteraceae bacterium IS3]|nr:MAG: hypothetical protein BWK80_19070 [Desulfobacteraceae bacterium IS3]